MIDFSHMELSVVRIALTRHKRLVQTRMQREGWDNAAANAAELAEVKTAIEKCDAELAK